MKSAKPIELLSPAKNLTCGIEAIKHGADAIYIGAPSFSARSSAGNSISDIKELCYFAHKFNVKIYVALNTILTDNELPEAEKIIWELWDEAKIDALIIQDLGITKLNLPPIPLHASTQMDNRTIEKAKFLEKVGFQQIVLARELTLDEIKKIRSEIHTPIEFFVHGALCVCYSGQCYLSEALSKRSANKGSCAQYCRLPYDLFDANGEEIINQKHLLSMKDLNLSSQIEDLIEAGVQSLKIEGRLKDVTYVKNVTAYYRQTIDAILNSSTKYKRSSYGKSTITFTPNLEKSFNRSFTQYFLNGRTNEVENKMWSINSPKSIGEAVGKIIKSDKKSITIKTHKKLNTGDGICFFDENECMQGTYINKIENNVIYFNNTFNIKPNSELFRNHDNDFDKILNRNNTAKRQLPINLELTDNSEGFTLKVTDISRNISIETSVKYDKELAKKDPVENIKNTLSKTGDTIFFVEEVSVKLAEAYFIPSSVLNNWKKDVLEILENKIDQYYLENERQSYVLPKTNHSFPIPNLTYLGNVMNEKSKLFYQEHNTAVTQMAFEKKKQNNVPLMFTRHCIKQSMGWCPKETKTKSLYKEPFSLRYKNIKLRLEFDCKACEMKVYND